MQAFSKIMHSYYPSELNRIEVKTDAIMAAVYLTREAQTDQVFPVLPPSQTPPVLARFPDVVFTVLRFVLGEEAIAVDETVAHFGGVKTGLVVAFKTMTTVL